MTDLLLSRGSTKYKEQVQKLLESQPAVKKDRAGELALGNSFLGLPGRGVVSRLGVQGRLKNRVGGPGPGWNGPGGAAQAREAGPTWKLQKRNFTSTRVIFFAFSLHFFCIVFAFVLHFFCIFCCISQTRSHFFCIFLAFPKPGVIVCIFLHFLDRVCHLHRLPDPYEKTTRKWTMLESRKRQENDKQMRRKWQKMT